MEEKKFTDNLALKAILYADVIQFNRDVIGTPVRMDTGCLSEPRLEFAKKVLTEEISEFEEAHTMNDSSEALDAMIDLIYYAFGRLYEMGVSALDFVKAWDAVHEANMKKVKGDKGRGSDQDAIKPEGWKKPEIKQIVETYSVPTDNLSVEQQAYIRGLEEENQRLLQEQNKPGVKFTLESWTEAVNVAAEAKLREGGYTHHTAKEAHGTCTGRFSHKKPNMSDTSEVLDYQNYLGELDIAQPFIECAELRKKKGADYRGSDIEMKDYFPFGLLSYTQMLHTKNLRLRSLVANGRTPKNESVRDTLLDMINYACFAIEAIDKGEV